MRHFNDPFAIKVGAGSLSEGLEHRSRFAEVSGSFLVGKGHSLWLGRLVSSKKIRFFLLTLFLVFLVLYGRLLFLQFAQGSHFRGLSEGNRLRLEQLSASRGIIFDRYGVSLVENKPSFTLFFESSQLKANPESAKPIEDVLRSLSLSTEEIEEILAKEGFLPVVVKENLAYEEALGLKIKTKSIEALKVEIDQKRDYRQNLGLAHLLGYTSRINQEEKDYYLNLGYRLTEKVGRSGIEEHYQAQLRGSPGKKQIEVDSLGREMKVVAEEAAVSGQSLFLSLDASLQEQINLALKKYLPNKAAAIVAMEPDSGKILGYASWPTFNSNAFSQGLSSEDYQALAGNPLKPFVNRVIGGEYPSGSTIKLIMGLAGLEEGLITRNSSIYSIGGVWYDKWFFPDWKEGGHGYTDIVKAIAESVNTFFYYLALERFEDRQGLGLDRMMDYFSRFGLGKALGIDIAGEKSGFLPSPEWKEETKNEIWYPGDTLHLSIGQGDLLVTPLQVAAFTAAVANNGTLYRPQLVEKLVNSESGETVNIGSEILGRNLGSPANLEIIRQGMRQAVIEGSARGIYGVSAAVAGKTGTAQVGGEQLPHAWFTGFLPYGNPQLVLTVMVEHGGEGSEIAVPIAREILSWYADNRL